MHEVCAFFLPFPVPLPPSPLTLFRCVPGWDARLRCSWHLRRGSRHVGTENLAAARASCLAAVLVAGQSRKVGRERMVRLWKWKREENLCFHNPHQNTNTNCRPENCHKPATSCIRMLFLYTINSMQIRSSIKFCMTWGHNSKDGETSAASESATVFSGSRSAFKVAAAHWLAAQETSLLPFLIGAVSFCSVLHCFPGLESFLGGLLM